MYATMIEDTNIILNLDDAIILFQGWWCVL